MKLYIKRAKSGIDATAEYDRQTRTVTVLKGSRVSATIAHTEKFRGSKSIEKSRMEYVKDCVVLRNAIFKSSSTAANFVTGTSTNGLTTWKNEDGTTLKEILTHEEA